MDPEGDILEHRAIEEKEMAFHTPENAELGHQALVSDTDDIPSTCPSPNPGEMEITGGSWAIREKMPVAFLAPM